MLTIRSNTGANVATSDITPGDGDVLAWSASAGAWVATTPSGGGGTPAGGLYSIQIDDGAGGFTGSSDFTYDGVILKNIAAAAQIWVPTFYYHSGGSITLEGWERLVMVTTNSKETITLPLASTVAPGTRIMFRDDSAGGQTVTIAPQGTDAIDVNSKSSLAGTDFGWLEMATNGVNFWWCIGFGVPI